MRLHLAGEMLVAHVPSSDALRGREGMGIPRPAEVSEASGEKVFVKAKGSATIALAG